MHRLGRGGGIPCGHGQRGAGSEEAFRCGYPCIVSGGADRVAHEQRLGMNIGDVLPEWVTRPVGRPVGISMDRVLTRSALVFGVRL